MRLHLSTWPDVERYLSRSTGIIIPIGSTEQHGPTGLIGTDAICPEVVAMAVGDQREIMVGPTLSIGIAQHHMAFPGTVTLRPSTLLRVIHDYVRSLIRHGFDRFYFLNGHGGNIATLGAAFSEIHSDRSLRPDGSRANHPGVRCVQQNWWAGRRTRSLAQTLYGAAEGAHATPSEISLTWHAHPEAERFQDLAPAPAAGRFFDADDFRRRYPDGRMGSDPSLSRVDHGRQLLATAVQDVIEDYESFMALT